MANSSNSSNLAFCLEYSNHKTDMLDAFDDYLRNESMVDVMLSCEGNTIKAHKMVLSAGSTYFRDIFSAFKNPFQFPVLIIKDMPFRDLKAIVEFLYRGEVVVPVEQVSSLSKSAQTLFIKGLEKYFNKSAVVNVGNPSVSTSVNRKTSVTTNSRPSASAVKPKPIPKPTETKTRRSISMSLRQTRRPNYRQLSNGDFDSDVENSEEEEHFDSESVQIGGTHVTYSGPNASQLSKRFIKSEKYANADTEPSDRELMPQLEAQSSVDDNDMNEEEDNGSDVVYQSDHYSGINYIDMNERDNEDEDETQLDDNEDGSGEPRGLIRNPVRVTPRRVKTPFMGRHRKRKAVNRGKAGRSESESTSAIRVGPIKADPDKVKLIECSLCPRVFSQNQSLSVHMKRIHGDDSKEHVCQLCGKKYSWRSGLYKHMRTHRNR